MRRVVTRENSKDRFCIPEFSLTGYDTRGEAVEPTRVGHFWTECGVRKYQLLNQSTEMLYEPPGLS